MIDGNGWIDVSVALTTGMVCYPGDPPVEIVRFADISKGAGATVSHISMSAHAGTHIDAPLHFFHGGRSIDFTPLPSIMGRARIIPINHTGPISRDELVAWGLTPGEIILLKTPNSKLWRNDAFSAGYAHLSVAAAAYAAEIGLTTIGIDYLSIGGFDDTGSEVHHILLEGSVCIVEGLDLSRVPIGACEFICLPLMLKGAEAAPARALVRPL
jgi:arylformamidase